jgi:hypothetical protein
MTEIDKGDSVAATEGPAPMNSLMRLAVILLVLWFVLRVIFGMAIFALHIVWAVAVTLLIVWGVRRFLVKT